MDIREKTGYKLERRLKGRLKLGCEEALYALLGVVGVLKCRPPSLVLHRVHVPAMTSSQGFVFQAPWRLMYALIGHSGGWLWSSQDGTQRQYFRYPVVIELVYGWHRLREIPFDFVIMPPCFLKAVDRGPEWAENSCVVPGLFICR